MNSNIPIYGIILVIFVVCIIAFVSYKIISSNLALLKKSIFLGVMAIGVISYLVSPYVYKFLHSKDIDSGIEYAITSGYEIVEPLKEDPTHYVGISKPDSSGNTFVYYTDKDRYGLSKTQKVNMNSVEIIKLDEIISKVAIEKGEKLFYKINSKNEKYVYRKEPIIRISISSSKIINGYGS